MITADSSMDSMDASDVEFMLQDVVSPSAPTPALPRFRTVDLSVDPATVPPELKNEGQDWFAVFNAAPPVPGDGGVKKRSLDVKLVHTLMHERCVCIPFRVERC